MHPKTTPVSQTLQEFKSLHSAIIDSSSIIYLSKINALDILSTSLSLWTVKDVITECKVSTHNFQISSEPTLLSTDQQLINLTLSKKIPVISEDFKILKTISNTDIPYFNSLMMISFLLFIEKISKNEFLHYRENLKQFARYNDFVWKYGVELLNEIDKSAKI
jgi:hypothetical protein